MTWITTFSGVRIDPIDPPPEDVRIVDIAHHLALTNRFSGASPVPYSVAEHCVRMTYLAPRALRLECLMHDASEAYLGDVTRHVKAKLPDYVEFERRVEAAIRRHFGLPGDAHPIIIKKWDNKMLVWESRDLGVEISESFPHITAPSKKLVPWGWQKAEQAFLDRFEELA